MNSTRSRLTDEILAAPQEATSRAERLPRFIRELYPICRNITGARLRQTLAEIGKRVPLVVTGVPSGRPVFDWTVPQEWNIRGE
jgi:aminopeptidase-like protein